MFKKAFLGVFLVFVICFSTQALLDADIIEIQQMEEIIPEIDADTLVFFDVDNTLLISECMLGSESWWSSTEKILEQTGITFENAASHLVPTMWKIFETVPQIALEKITPELIRNLQDQNQCVFGLTARDLTPPHFANFDLLTHHQLRNVLIDFSNHSLDLEGSAISNFFSHGIIFTCEQLKGPYLLNFLQSANLHPRKVIFIDDNLKQLQSVQASMDALGICFTGFHYLASRKFHEAFDPLIANIQLSYLLNTGQLLSDEEARERAPLYSDRDPNFCLYELIDRIQSSL